MSKTMYRYPWLACDEPRNLSNEDLIGKFDFYRFVYKWTPEGERNELQDRISDLYDEIVRRKLNKKD
ncbi:MAG: hypothetical protein LIR46_06900 [Bacteroidota bacterium]|nr:hypothetical protein [Bacteroidota bacterium]